MKKNILLIFGVCLLTSCNNNASSSSTYEVIEDSSEQYSHIFDEDMYYEENEDFNYKEINKLSIDSSEVEQVLTSNYEHDNFHVEDIKYAEFFLDSKLQDSLTAESKPLSQDLRYIFYNGNDARIVSKSEGYAINMPTTTLLKTDLSIAKYRSQFDNQESTLTITTENKNPYGSWSTYDSTWLSIYINDKSFLTKNNISYTSDVIRQSTSILPNYSVDIYSLVINDNENIEKPYYNIAVIRKINESTKFKFLVMKSKTNQNESFLNMISSYKEFNGLGTLAEVDKFDIKIPNYWNNETQRYYKKLLEQDYTEWGLFWNSMDVKGSTDMLIEMRNEAYSNAMEYDFGIAPTYTHIGQDYNGNNFPVETTMKFAGGNGFNNKPVLQYTLQFTTSNNENLDGYTPIFDVYRGKYDNYFRNVAKSMKEYARPILFRLNNEMNSDWTSYCGVVSLCDPDIFAATWERMARIFEEEKVDNVIYIFNPNSVSCPYSSWGEDLCYLPSMKYVQVLGLTYYESNNTDEDPKSFYELYSWLYNKNKPFIDFPAIISEFACGSGGSTSGTLYRNHISQALWVESMFECLNYRNDIGMEFAKQIKGAVWFSCNDYISGKVSNNYMLSLEFTAETITAFKNGLAETKLLKNEQQ